MIKIAILTEGGENIGFGHLTRCLSLCQAFESRGHEVEFIVKGDDSIKNILEEKRFRVFNWIEQEKNMLQSIKEVDVVIVDSYLAEAKVYKKISNNAATSVFLDDIRRIDYPAGIVINWSICALDLGYPNRNGNEVSYLLGPGYVSLRQAFRDVPEKKIKEKVNSVMVTFGGDDSKNLTPKVLSFLTREYPLLKKNVIIGNAFKNVEEIKAAADVYTRFIHSLDDLGMKDIMLESDVAISSGGQTLYELARVGVPTVAVVVAENQRKNVKSWEKTGFIENAGFWEDRNLMDNLAIKFHLFMDYLRRSQSAKAGRQLVPYNGADRIVEFIQSNKKNRPEGP